MSEATRKAVVKSSYNCNYCASTGKVLYVTIIAGKMSGYRNCPRCNRNGRRIARDDKSERRKK